MADDDSKVVALHPDRTSETAEPPAPLDMKQIVTLLHAVASSVASMKKMVSDEICDGTNYPPPAPGRHRRAGGFGRLPG